MSEPEGFAFYRNTGGPVSEEDWTRWTGVRDAAFPIPVVSGDKLPDWSMRTAVCPNGCHVRVYLLDAANRQSYLIHDMLVQDAQTANLLDFAGNVNPLMERAETLRHVASLN